MYKMSNREATCQRMLFTERPGDRSRTFLLIFVGLHLPDHAALELRIMLSSQLST